MELQQLWVVLVRRWWIILLPAVVAVVLLLPSVPAMLRPPSTYTLTIRFTASQSPTSDNAKTFQDQSYIPWLASEYAVANLATWMRTDSFAREMALLLKAQALDLSADAIRGAIISDAARSIMTIAIRWSDPDQLKALGAAAVTVLQTKNADYFAQFGAEPARVVALDEASVVPDALPLATRFAPLFRVALGLALGFALAFVAEYFDQSIRTRADLTGLGLIVLGEIPPQ